MFSEGKYPCVLYFGNLAIGYVVFKVGLNRLHHTTEKATFVTSGHTKLCFKVLKKISGK